MSIDAPVGRPKAASDPRRPKRKRKGAKRGFFRRYWWAFVAAPLLFGVVVLVALFIAYERLQLPQTLPPIQSTILYDRHGTQLAVLHGTVDRTVVPLSQMSPDIQHAVIATEDHGFYSHPAIDPLAILRAAWTNIVRHHVVEGASTITEQLVKNVYAGTTVTQPDEVLTCYREAVSKLRCAVKQAQ